MFLSQELNEQGVYALRMVKDGLNVDVVIDGYIPVD
jgi:hypothetical protein